MNPTQLSRELRQGQSPDLTRRRCVAGLSLLGAAMGQLVALYQIGIVERLPDPSGPLGEVFDATKVDASDYAYKRANTPDGFLMLGTYAVTAGLAAAGGQNRAHEAPLLPLATAAKVGYDVVTNLRLAREEWADTSSTQGRHGTKHGAAYSASKYGLVGLVKSAALEFGEHHITVNAVIPGLIDTPLTRHESRYAQAIEEAGQQPTGDEREDESLAAEAKRKWTPLGVPFIPPEDVAPVVLFLASDEARMVSGATYDVTGGDSAHGV